MKKLLLSVLTILFTTIAISQPQWSALPNAPSGLGRFDDIFFLNEDLGWAANGPSGIVFKTEDGGDTWTQQLALNSYFRNIEFIDENIGFLGTLDGVFYRTTNGGDTWSPVTINPNPSAICGLDAVGSSTVYGVGAWFSPAWMIKSTDAGATWNFTGMSAYAQALVETLFIDELHGFVSGKAVDGGVILETFDGGITWTEIFNSGEQGDYVWKLQLMENNTVIYGSVQSNSQGKLVKSFDSGATWEVRNAPEEFVQAVGFLNRDRGWMGGHGTGFHETTDGGLTWTNMNLGFTLNRFQFLSEDLAYCSGESIYKWEDVLSVNEFEESNRELLNVKIAPLPVTDKLSVEIEFSHIDNLVIELYSLSGQLVKHYTRDQIPEATNKTYTFDFPYPAGTYILDVHTNNARKAITLIKN